MNMNIFVKSIYTIVHSCTLSMVLAICCGAVARVVVGLVSRPVDRSSFRRSLLITTTMGQCCRREQDR